MGKAPPQRRFVPGTSVPQKSSPTAVIFRLTGPDMCSFDCPGAAPPEFRPVDGPAVPLDATAQGALAALNAVPRPNKVSRPREDVAWPKVVGISSPAL